MVDRGSPFLRKIKLTNPYGKHGQVPRDVEELVHLLAAHRHVMQALELQRKGQEGKGEGAKRQSNCQPTRQTG